MGKLAATCEVGMAQRMLADILDETQFETLHVAANATEARKYAMDHIKEQAALHGVQRYWSSGKRTSPPTVRDVPKNKLDELQGWKVAPQQFCLDHIPLSAWRHVVWPFLSDPLALWSLGASNTHMMRWAHRIFVMTIRFEPWHSLHDKFRRLFAKLHPRDVPGPPHRPPRVPSHWTSGSRLLSPLVPASWKTRLIFSHYRHPLRARGRIISRCLQLLIGEAMRVLGTLEMAHCKDLLSVVRESNTRLFDLWHTGDLWGPVELFDLDIKAMFASLNRQDVWDAFNTITDCVVAAPRPTRRPCRGALRFAINKIDRKLVRLGTGHFELFHNVHIDDVKRYVYFDVFCNDAFVFTNLVLRQTNGLAIGGPCSSQLASIKCMSSAHHFYPSYPPFALQGQPPIHPCNLPVPPRRFRDNINGIKHARMPLDLLRQCFEFVYNLDLQQEGHGQMDYSPW